jgi:hypothetical protein
MSAKPTIRDRAMSGFGDLVYFLTVAFPSWAGLLAVLYMLTLSGTSPLNLFWRNPR